MTGIGIRVDHVTKLYPVVSRKLFTLNNPGGMGNMMLKDITHVQPLENHCLRLRFEDGVEGSVDIAALVKFTGVFNLLQDRGYFLQVRVNPDLGTICWPNDADLDPDVLYAFVTGQPLTLSASKLALAA
jgi:hypothetical protein